MPRAHLRGTAALLCAALLTAGCGGAERGAAPALPDRSQSRSTSHPDPCGVDNKLDGTDRPDSFLDAPAGRVESAAQGLFGDRYLGVYIANVEQQYGVGLGVHQLTQGDADAFFEATCFRVGDVVLQNGVASRSQLKGWRDVASEILDRPDSGACSLSDRWQSGTVEVVLEKGHQDTRRELQRAIPAEHLSVREGECMVAR